MNRIDTAALTRRRAVDPGKIVLGSMNRGGLQGAGFAFDDR